MEEIKVNDYIRTKEGYVGKVLRLGDEFSYDCIFESGDYKYAIGFQNIVKHSPNVIDLIEVGDIVEIFDVLHNDIIFIWNKEMLKALREDIENGIQIKSITTKEQFNYIKYVIGE